MTTQATQLVVGMAEIQVARGPATLTCIGLGSCIGFLVVDPSTGVCGMVHIMLPESFRDRPVDKLGKFADTGLPELIKSVEKLGVSRSRLICAYAGGAQVFQFGAAAESRLDVGARNSTAVADFVRKLGLRVVAHDVGGSSGRTMVYDSSTGEVVVRTLSKGTKVLCSLRG